MLGKRSIVIAVLALCLLLPASALGADEEFEGVTNAFTLKASNGYSLLVLASSRHADGRGELVIFVDRRGRSVTYFTKATVTETGIEADLGVLGRIDVDYVATGGTRRVHSPCNDESATFERADYRGTIEFRGEEGYTSTNATRARIDNSVWLRLVCSETATYTEGFDSGLPGARLTAEHGTGRPRLAFTVIKNSRPARAGFAASVDEVRAGVQISRHVGVWAGASAFVYDPLLRTATVDPPAPFAGSAIFRRGAKAKSRWLGNLTVDFPGRSDVPLAGPGMHLSLVHAEAGGPF